MLHFIWTFGIVLLLTACGGGSPVNPQRLSEPGPSSWIRGDLGDVSFGVRFNSDVSTPWIDGPEPQSHLVPIGMSAFDQAPPPSGTVTWRGILVGYTPSIEFVMGNADLEVNLPSERNSATTGNLRFDDLRFRETDVPWNVDSLNYTVSVARNGFVGTGGDDGAASGSFFGQQHEWMAGTLDRSDLTAAFGGER